MPDLSPLRTAFDLTSVHARFVVYKAPKQVFIHVLPLSPVSIIPVMFHTHLYLRSLFNGIRLQWVRHNFPNSLDLSVIRENWIQQYFHFFYLARVNGQLRYNMQTP